MLEASASGAVWRAYEDARRSDLERVSVLNLVMTPPT